jgi:hypothetical protein
LKFRTDFVTNSSSSSFIICFARIADAEKAKPILEKYNIDTLDVDGVNFQRRYTGVLGAEWCNAIIYTVDDTMKRNPDGRFIVIEDYNNACYDDDGDPIYSYNFDADDAIRAITEENGFADVEISEGEGRDG